MPVRARCLCSKQAMQLRHGATSWAVRVVGKRMSVLQPKDQDAYNCVEWPECALLLPESAYAAVASGLKCSCLQGTTQPSLKAVRLCDKHECSRSSQHEEGGRSRCSRHDKDGCSRSMQCTNCNTQSVPVTVCCCYCVSIPHLLHS